MKAILKSVNLNGPVGFDDFWPDDGKKFGVWLTLTVGPDDQDGGHLFQVLVCTPDWLKKECSAHQALWGRHMLIISEYDSDLIVQEIINYIDSISETDFWEAAQKISRIGAWEFEDYQLINNK